MKAHIEDKWQKLHLGDIAGEIRDLYEPNQEEHLKYIGLEHIEQKTLQLKSVGISSDTQSTKKKFYKNDILYGTLRPYFRKVIKVAFSGVCSTDITVIRSKKNFNQDFLFYFIANPFFIDYSTKISSGTRMPRAKWKTLEKSEWYFPPEKEINKISSILSNYDKLIYLNNQKLKILKEILDLIYHEWFINFKISNIKLKDSDLGKIPEDWQVKKLGDAIEISGGGTPSTKVDEYWKDGDINWFTPSDLTTSRTTFISYSSRKITDLGLKKSSAKIFPPYCVMMTSRATVGVVAINTKFSCTNQGFITCIPNKQLPVYYLYHWIKNNVSMIKQHASGTTFKEIIKSIFRTFSIIIPNTEIMKKYFNIVGPIFKQIEILEQTNLNLRKTRDILIPKLIMGEIKINEH